MTDPVPPPPEAPPTASAPESYGRYLSRERELRNITLEHVAEVTRISVENLRALEEGRHDRLPGRVFVIGYIRAYARCIGLAADDAVLRFQEQVAATNATPNARKPPVAGRWRLLVTIVAVAAIAAGAAWFLHRHP
jgi:cytoskeletal protein RodZ